VELSRRPITKLEITRQSRQDQACLFRWHTLQRYCPSGGTARAF
jgi:hypothetical protein